MCYFIIVACLLYILIINRINISLITLCYNLSNNNNISVPILIKLVNNLNIL